MSTARIFFLLVLYAAGLTGAFGQEASDILEKTRQAMNMKSIEVFGQLHHGKQTRSFHLLHQNGTANLQVEGLNAPLEFDVSHARQHPRFHQAILRDMPFAPADIIWSWLWSKNAQTVGTQKLRSRKTWQLDISEDQSNSGRTQIWVDQKSYAPLKIETFDQENQLGRRIELISTQVINGKWVPKKIRVEKFIPDRQPSTASRSYIELSKYREH
jgi:hypothetical protein